MLVAEQVSEAEFMGFGFGFGAGVEGAVLGAKLLGRPLQNISLRSTREGELSESKLLRESPSGAFVFFENSPPGRPV